MLDATQPATNDVAKRLAYDGHAEPLLQRPAAKCCLAIGAGGGGSDNSVTCSASSRRPGELGSARPRGRLPGQRAAELSRCVCQPAPCKLDPVQV
jgi:hypothetical protein